MLKCMHAFVPGLVWRLCRYHGSSKNVAVGVLFLVGIANQFAFSMYRQYQEYRADEQASQDPEVVLAGVNFFEQKVLPKEKSLEDSINKLSQKGFKLSYRELVEVLKYKLKQKFNPYNNTKERIERLRILAQELEQKKKLDSEQNNLL